MEVDKLAGPNVKLLQPLIGGSHKANDNLQSIPGLLF